MARFIPRNKLDCFGLRPRNDTSMKQLFLLLIIMLLWPQVIVAQTEFREISISPFLEELKVDKGGTVSSGIEVTNTSGKNITVAISARDFLPGQRGEPEFIPDTEFNDVTFSLASWIKFPSGNQFELAPNETKKIPYTVNPPVNAEQGSHYGAVLFSLAGGATLSGVGINQSIGTIIIVSYGEARPEGQLEFSAEPTIIWWNDRVEFTNQFINSGRVHVKPKGEVYVTNILGKIVASPATNRDAANVLPQSDRTFISEWDPSSFAFGPYTVESVISFGDQKLELRQKETVWVLPVYFLIVIALVLVLIAWYFTHGRHWHRRKVIAKHFS